MPPDRALVAGWFSLRGGGATAGDLRVRDLAVEWLQDAGHRVDVANDPPFDGGVDWRSVDPGRYGTAVFACGPFFAGRRVARVLNPRRATLLARIEQAIGPRARNPLTARRLDLLVARFPHARWIGLNLSMLGPPGTWHPFDHLFTRDGPDGARPDVAFMSPEPAGPVLGLCLVDAQREYGDARHDVAGNRLRALAAARDAAVVDIDTRLDIPNRSGLHTPDQIESVIGAVDVLLTTRLHGLVFALRRGVPALALDPVAGGAKITAQAQAVGWPAVVGVDRATDEELSRWLAWCLTDEARARARACRERALKDLEAARADFLAAVRAA